MAYGELEGAGGLLLSEGNCEDRSREVVDIGVGMNVHMWISEASLVVMSDRRVVNWAESLRMMKMKTVYGGCVVVISQRRAVEQTH